MERNIITRDAVRRSGPGNAGPSGPVGPSGPAAATGYALDAVWPGYGTSLLSSYDASGFTEGTQVWVNSVGRFFRLTYNSFLPTTGVGDVSVLPASGVVNAQWIGISGQNNYWQSQTVWYIDPAGTNPTVGGVPGNDENSGLTATHPFKTIAEFRRRNFSGTISGVIHVLSSSANSDDQYFYGFTTTPGTVGIEIVGVPTVVFSSTITGYVSPIANGNNRGQIVNSALAVSWTASGGISSASGSRFIRNAAGVHAAIIKDLGSKTCQIGIPSNVSETPGVFTSTPTDFVNGNAYDVCSQLRWPGITSVSRDLVVNAKCVDFYLSTGSSFGASSIATLVGFLAGFQGNFDMLGCYARGSGGSGGTVPFIGRSSAFVGPGVLLVSRGSGTWHGLLNTFLGAIEFRVWHSGVLNSTGVLQVFDNTGNFLSVRYSSNANIVPDSMIGDNNSGPLVVVEYGSVVTGASAITAVTSAAPYLIAGVASATPYFDSGVGTGVYN